MRRRAFLGGLATTLIHACRSHHPRVVASGPVIAPPLAIQSGDADDDRLVVWCKAASASRMILEWSESPQFSSAARVVGPVVTLEEDLTGVVDLRALPRGATIHYRVALEDLGARSQSAWSIGRARTPPSKRADVTFAWSADVAGQGWGIDRDRGGMLGFASMRQASPDFFLHAGDRIYADQPIPASMPLRDGSVWKNLVTDATSRVASTLDNFRGRYAYNLLDDHARAFAAEVPSFSIWSDHEVENDWGGSSPRASNARRAMLEWTPIRRDFSIETPLYRSVRWGPSLEIFLLDGRSYRTSDDANDLDDDAYLGAAQLAWLKRALVESHATWKILLCEQPIAPRAAHTWTDDGTILTYESWANVDGPPRGRERELASLLSHLRAHGCKNLVWLTGDVHYAAAHVYDPSRARFVDFDPFWEFIAGPLHAGPFAPLPLDNTFGPEIRYVLRSQLPLDGPPTDGLQSFGLVHLDGASERLTISLRDVHGATLYETAIDPVRT